MEWQVPEPLATATVPLVDGATVLLSRHGNVAGRRLIVSHANALSSDAYLPFWSLLAGQFEVVLYDLRGHGANPPGELLDHTVAMMAQDNRRIVRAIDRHFGKKPRIGVFHSVSAAVAVLHVWKRTLMKRWSSTTPPSARRESATPAGTTSAPWASGWRRRRCAARPGSKVRKNWRTSTATPGRSSACGPASPNCWPVQRCGP